MTDSPAISAHQLGKRFGDLDALVGLELAVGRGEVFGYLGPNGAGKTTTIRLLLDFLRPTAGRVTVLGGSGSDPAIRRRIGYLPGDLHLDPSYTTNEVIDFFGRLRGGVDRGHVDGLLERFDLDPTRPIGELSTGNRRKAGIVQAFMGRPELLVLDEPTSGLDPLLQQEFNALVREASRDGATVFLSSHVLPEVEVLARRIAILRRGELVTVAEIDELRRQARQRLDLHLAVGTGPEAADGSADAAFAGVAGVVEHSVVGRTVRLVIEGSVDAALKVAATLEVERIVSHEADLEDVFLAYYRPQADGVDDGNDGGHGAGGAP